MDEKELELESENTLTEEPAESAAAEEEKSSDKKKKKKDSKQEKIDELQAELAEKNDLYLRLYAEFDNYKKRTVRERETIELSARSDTVGLILPLADNIERALAAGGDAESLKKGMEMALNQFIGSLKANDVELIPTDIPFDPNIHNAVMHVEDEEHGPGEIIEVFQKGYRIKDRVIRHAMVKVAN